MQQAKVAGILGAAMFCFAGPATAQTTVEAEPVVRREKPAQPFVPDAKTLALLDRSSAYLASPGLDGRRRLVTNGGHRHVLMARVGPDGVVETFCADSVHAAQNWGAGAGPREHER